MTVSDRTAVVIGLTAVGAAVGLGVLGALLTDRQKPTKKTDYGLTVDPQCNSFTVSSEQKIRDSIRAEVRTMAKRGADPFEITASFLKKAAPHCTSYPNARNPGEAELFVLTLNTTLDVMEDEKLLSQAQMVTFKEMARVWAIAQGVSPESF